MFIACFSSVEHFKSRWYLFPKDMLQIKQGAQEADGPTPIPCSLLTSKQVMGTTVVFPCRMLGWRNRVGWSGRLHCPQTGWITIPLGLCVKEYCQKFARSSEILKINVPAFSLIIQCSFFLSPNSPKAFHCAWNEDPLNYFQRWRATVFNIYQKLGFISHQERFFFFINQRGILLHGAPPAVTFKPSWIWGYWAFCCIK